jgi:SAM-dependent methyltransferase
VNKPADSHPSRFSTTLPTQPHEVPRPLSVFARDPNATDRSEFLEWAGGDHRRVLDVGCGAGANAPWYRRHGTIELVGVEIDRASAELAARAYDKIVCGPIENAISELNGPFDLIVCADVLEHLMDPWHVVQELHSLAGPATTLAVSMPNIRYLRALAKIAFGRGFAYEPSGIFDSSHLRFFAKPNIESMLLEGGWSPQRWGAPRVGRFRDARRAVQRLTHHQSDSWLAVQLYTVAVPTRA